MVLEIGGVGETLKSPFNVAVAVAYADLDSHINIESGTVVDSELGNVDITSKIQRKSSVSASGGGTDGFFGITVVVSNQTMDNTINVGGQVTGESVNIDATSITTADSLDAAARMGDGFWGKKVKKVKAAPGQLLTKVKGWLGVKQSQSDSGDQKKKPSKPKNTKFSLAAAFSYGSSDTNTKVTLSPDADILARAGDLTLNAYTKDIYRSFASAFVYPDEDQSGEQPEPKPSELAVALAGTCDGA